MRTSTFDDRDSAAPIPGSYEARLLEARSLRAQGQNQEAIDILERILNRLVRLPEQRRGPGSDLRLYLISSAALIADIKYELGDIAAAKALWKQIEQWDTVFPSRWRREPFQRQILRGEVDEALRELIKIAEEEPDELTNWLAAGWAAFDADQLDVVETCLLQTEPLLHDNGYEEDFAKYYLLRHSLNMSRGQWREALDDWKEAAAFDPELEMWTEMTVRSLLRAEQYDLALELLEDESLEEPVVQYYQAWIAQHHGDTIRARHLWRQVLEAEDNEIGSFVGLRAMALCWLGRPLEAVAELLDEATTMRELIPPFAGALALASGMQGRLDAARANLTTGTRHDSMVTLFTSLEWYDFDTLISDEEIKAGLREFFDLD